MPRPLSGRPSGRRPGSLLRRVPAYAWLATYRREDLGADARAGATVAVLLVPQAMAYAVLAGMPPIAGLYAAMVSLVVYAALGTSRFISVGPVAIDSLLTAAAVGPLADGDTGRYVALAGALAILTGLLQVAAGLARLGALVNLLSVPVIAGFTSAAAVTIGTSQLTDLLGLDVHGRGTTFVQAARGILPALPTVDPLTAGLGACAVVALAALRRWAPALPGPLLVLGAATALTWGLGLDVRQVGEVPSGLPVPRLPAVDLADLRALLPSAAAIALISYMESISTATAFARRTRTRVRPDQELIAVGSANAAAGLVRGLPVAGGFSRGAVNVDAGARSPMSGVVAAVLVAVSLFTLTPLLAQVPTAALAALIIVAVAGLVDVSGARAVGRVRRSDLLALLATALATLVLGPALGLGVGVGVSLALFLRHLTRPHMPELGLVESEGVFRNVARHRTRTDPRVLVLRVDAPLSFMGAREIAERVNDLVRDRPPLAYVVLDGTGLTDADYTGVEMLRDLDRQLAELGIALHLAALRGPVADVLARTAWYAELAADGRSHPTVMRAVSTLPVGLVRPDGR